MFEITYLKINRDGSVVLFRENGRSRRFRSVKDIVSTKEIVEGKILCFTEMNEEDLKKNNLSPYVKSNNYFPVSLTQLRNEKGLFLNKRNQEIVGNEIISMIRRFFDCFDTSLKTIEESKRLFTLRFDNFEDFAKIMFTYSQKGKESGKSLRRLLLHKERISTNPRIEKTNKESVEPIACGETNYQISSVNTINIDSIKKLKTPNLIADGKYRRYIFEDYSKIKLSEIDSMLNNNAVVLYEVRLTLTDSKASELPSALLPYNGRMLLMSKEEFCYWNELRLFRVDLHSVYFEDKEYLREVSKARMEMRQIKRDKEKNKFQSHEEIKRNKKIEETLLFFEKTRVSIEFEEMINSMDSLSENTLQLNILAKIMLRIIFDSNAEIFKSLVISSLRKDQIERILKLYKNTEIIDKVKNQKMVGLMEIKQFDLEKILFSSLEEDRRDLNEKLYDLNFNLTFNQIK